MPVFHKGFSPSISPDNLVLARNLSLGSKYSYESEKNIVLSSSLVAEKGMPASTSNRLTPLIYSKVFNIFGFNQKIPLYVSIFLYAFTTILLFLLVLRLFSLKIALIFAGIDIFMPFVLAGSVWFGFYEWAMLFFTIAVLIYLWKKKANWLRLFLSGSFFVLAALARNAFLISFIPFLIYDFYSNFIYKKNRRAVRLWLWPAIKRAFIFILPVLLLWGGFMIQDYIQKDINRYVASGDAGYNGHLFRDPYTYHFDKDNYIKEIQDTTNGETLVFLEGYGYDINLKQKLITYFYSAKYYLNEFFRQPTLGGPLIIFFLILGAIYLFRTKRRLFDLAIFWIAILFFILIFVFRTSNWDHFLEIRFPLILLISLGVYWIASWLGQNIKSKKVYYWLVVGLFLVLFSHLIQADKWLFHEKYLYSGMSERLGLVELIKKTDLEIGLDEVIATGVPRSVFLLNYYADYNYIYFTPETIKKLLQENKLQWAFDQFGVTKVIGYPSELTESIIERAEVENID